LPFSIGSPKLLRRSYTSKTKKRALVRRSHTKRNISILATLVVVVVIIVALSVALSPPPSYIMIVHVYDTTKANPPPQTLLEFTPTMAVHNVNVTVSGPNYPPTTRGPGPDGIVGWGPDDQLVAGSYQITISSNGYQTNTVTYVLGPNCSDRTSDGQCHPLVPMTPKP